MKKSARKAAKQKRHAAQKKANKSKRQAVLGLSLSAPPGPGGPPPPLQSSGHSSSGGGKGWWRLLGWAERLFAAFGVLVTIWGVLVELLPRVEISAETLLNPKNPFSTQFEVKNTGALDLHKVTVGFTPERVEVGGYVISNGEEGSTWIRNQYQNIELLKTDDHVSLSLNKIAIFDFPTAVYRKGTYRVNVEVTFRPSFRLWSGKVMRRFEAVFDEEGNVHWNSIPVGSSKL